MGKCVGAVVKFGRYMGEPVEWLVLEQGEVKKYLGSNEERICFATEYAKKNGVFVYEGKCAWWLRSPGERENCGNDCLEVVQNDGSLFDDGVECSWSDLAVRPAMWADEKVSSKKSSFN